jgi:undecaprenyl-diphosphatase
VLLVGCALGLGTLVTQFVVGHELGQDDYEVARWFAERRTGFRNDLSLVGSYFAETVTVLVILAVVLAVFAVRRYWRGFGLLVVSLSLEAMVYVAATYVISRDRPAVPRLEHLIVSDSFPSGHTAASVALYGCVMIVVWDETRNRVLRFLTLALAVAAPLVVATSRVYRGMHNPTDVLSGALIGLGCIAAAWFAVRVGEAAARARREDDGSPPARTARIESEPRVEGRSAEAAR